MDRMDRGKKKRIPPKCALHSSRIRKFFSPPPPPLPPLKRSESVHFYLHVLLIFFSLFFLSPPPPLSPFTRRRLSKRTRPTRGRDKRENRPTVAASVLAGTLDGGEHKVDIDAAPTDAQLVEGEFEHRDDGRADLGRPLEKW